MSNINFLIIELEFWYFELDNVFYIFYIIYNDIVYINNKEELNIKNNKSKMDNNFLYSLELDKLMNEYETIIDLIKKI